MKSIPAARGQCFEEFKVGDTLVSPGRTIIEADIVNFAGVSGDFTQLHTNAEYARQGVFGQRVAHGLLGMAVASGLLAQLGFVEGTIQAFRELAWKFSLPIFIGDTLHVQAAVIDLKAMPRLKNGAVTLEIQVINQHDRVVQSGQWVLLVASRRPGAGEAAG
jgi:3-hydroxybutyryl-CoA dehydratase